MQIILFNPSRFKLFLDLRKFKKEHRHVTVIEKGVDTYRYGYKSKFSRIYWAIVLYDD